MRSPFFLVWLVAALVPVLIPASAPANVSFYNEMAALFGWGAVLLYAGWAAAGSSRQTRNVAVGLGVLGLCSVALFAGEGVRVATVVAVSVLLGWTLGRWPERMTQAVDGLFFGLALAALGAGMICIFQFFLPDWTDGSWIAPSQTAGRSVGNLRQPNLQATMAVWGAIASAGLAVRYSGVRLVFPLLLISVVFTVALTGSRTGMVLTGLLLLWGWLDRGLPGSVRSALIMAPLLLWGCQQLLTFWAHQAGSTYIVETRAHSGSDISSSRFAIWSNTLELIRAEPWTGVGWGNFNFAWTLTDFQQRPVAFFDHAHNLPLHLAVELGIPLTALVCGIFLWLSWRARGALLLSDAHEAGIARTVLVMLVAVLFHSLLEYPLWYSYFLLPSVFLWALYLRLGWPRKGQEQGQQDQSAEKTVVYEVLTWPLMAAGAVLLLGTSYAIWDYQRIAQIFAPRGAIGARPLQERIREGQQSWLFGAQADYAAVTTAAQPSEEFEAFERPLHRLIDARLMIAYARALNERGERDKAAYVAQRLREFRHPLGDKFFAACDAPAKAGEALPFQCETVPIKLTFRDFEAARQ